MKKTILMLTLLSGFTACQSDGAEKAEIQKEIEFDKAKWEIEDGYSYRYRDRMLADLLADDTLKKLNRGEIYQLLGEPTRTDSLYLFYTIAQKRLGFWPLHTKSLVIKLQSEEAVEWVKIHK